MITETTVLAPVQIDDLCIQFDDAKIKVEEAQQDLSTAKGELLAAIQSQGYVPAHAEKTTRLEGQLYIADSIESLTTEMNDAAIAELQSELSRLKKPKVFKSLFARRVKYSINKDAAGKLKLAIAPLADDVQKRILGIYAACVTFEPKAPSVRVYLSQALREKEAEAEKKAAEKAARKTKKR